MTCPRSSTSKGVWRCAGDADIQAKMHSLIIHMDGDTARAPNVRALMDMLPNAEVLPAIRGVDHVGTYPAQDGNLHRPAYPFTLSPGELGCFLSHRAAWARIVDAGWDHALIVEDDAAFDPGIWDRVQTILARRDVTNAYVRLPARLRETGRMLDQESDVQLIRPRRIGLQTVAQIVGQGAARRLLDVTQTIDRPVDTFLQMHWITGQPIDAVLPCPVRELTAELGGSTIQKKTHASGKLAREFKRAMYRARVAVRPQAG